jgi:gamma-glutamylcysteine synthetase
MDRAERAIDELARGFLARFPARARRPRSVGREAEFPIVAADGRAASAAPLWHALLERTGGRAVHDVGGALVGVETSRWFCLAEVGLATIEIGVGPRASLLELAADLDEALTVVVPTARRLGLHVLGHGIQPRTPPHPRLLTPKARYEALVRAIGTGWVRWTVTASDQLHVDVGRDDLVGAMNALNALSGAIIALGANSGVLGGRIGANASGREALSARVSGEPFRNGAVPRRFADARDYVAWTTGFRALVLPDRRGRFRVVDVRYRRLLERPGRAASLESWLFHEHYVWPSARPRARLGTLEIRPACQQPGADFAAAALSLGLVESADDVLAWLEDRLPGRAGWRRLLAYRRAAVRKGIRAPEPFRGFLARTVELAARGLERRGLGEAALLDPVHERLARRRGPADEARAIARRAGIPGLVRALAIDR